MIETKWLDNIHVLHFIHIDIYIYFRQQLWKDEWDKCNHSTKRASCVAKHFIPPVVTRQTK